MDVVKPIFIVGTGRCGSTAFHKLLGAHPQLMWLSGFAEEFPFHPALNRWAVIAQSNPLVKRLHALPMPVVASNFIGPVILKEACDPPTSL